MKMILRLTTIAMLAAFLAPTSLAESAERFVGTWTLTLPNGQPGWLGVDEQDGRLSAQMLWAAGSVFPLENAAVEDDKLILKRVRKLRRRKPDRRVTEITETITAERAGDILKLTLVSQPNAGKPTRQEFSGKWCPPVPPKPDLSQAKFAEPIVLFNGKNLDGWKLTNPNQVNGWSAQDGELVNKPVQPENGHISYGNLQTVNEFEDYNLKLEVNVGERENSGIYLRGIYEIQVSDSFGRNLDSHNMGGVYSRIAPTVSAEKPVGQWQTFDITLLDRHVTVVLNGKKIIDNQPVHGCTGGALWADPFKPGPIYLQGDHTGIRYRNMVLTPIVKD
jgi:3-keto-disaccharide hydrolase